jgi:hypothetical protein
MIGSWMLTKKTQFSGTCKHTQLVFKIQITSYYLLNNHLVEVPNIWFMDVNKKNTTLRNLQTYTIVIESFLKKS